MEGMDIDDYSRDRSPVRDRSPSGGDRNYGSSDRNYSSNRGRDNYSSREYGSRDYGSRDYGSRDYGSRSFGENRRGGYRSSRDYGERSSYSSGNDDLYRAKTERNYDNSVFIGNIPFDCTSKDVESIFGNEFSINRADIVTNRGQSRGMATVEFNSKDDVRNAINKFDRYEYRGREIFVRQDYPPPSEKGGSFRGGRTYDNRRGGYESRGGSRGGRGGSYGTSRYDSGYSRGYDSGRTSSSYQPAEPGTEVFIANLPFSINWQALKDLMREAGEVVRADVRLDDRGRSKGFGTVVFNTKEDADKAIEMFQGYEIEGRKLDTRAGKVNATPGSRFENDAYSSKEETAGSSNSEFTEGVIGDGPKSDTIYVANLPFATQNDDLYELFETIGRTTKAEIQYLPNGRSSGNAVVQFELEESAENVINQLNGYLYGGRNLNITYATKP